MTHQIVLIQFYTSFFDFEMGRLSLFLCMTMYKERIRPLYFIDVRLLKQDLLALVVSDLFPIDELHIAVSVTRLTLFQYLFFYWFSGFGQIWLFFKLAGVLGDCSLLVF